MTDIWMDAACFHSIEDLCTKLHAVYSHSEFFECFRDRAACGVEDYPRPVPRLIVATDDILPTR
jgi:hypothetical protein